MDRTLKLFHIWTSQKCLKLALNPLGLPQLPWPQLSMRDMDPDSFFQTVDFLQYFFCLKVNLLQM